MRWFLVFLCLLPLVSAQLETSDLYNREHLVLEATIGSSVEIVPEQEDWLLDYVLVELFFAPVEHALLEVQSLETIPKAEYRDGLLGFRWEYPTADVLRYEVRSRVKTHTRRGVIPEKVAFPLRGIPSSTEPYVRRTESVDFQDTHIRRVADRLARGEDNLWVVANKVAVWVRDNIVYNLSTVTTEASKPASWVLRNRRGVCDELTNLYLAMMRSLGVPARFVSGVSYTNSPLFDTKWGPHGWAEVYFPGHGWVPFDPTYGQFGWLDPSHIKLRVAADATEPSTRFEWQGRHVDLGVHPLDFTVDVVDRGPMKDSGIALSNRLLKPAVGFGSYNVVETTVMNNNPYYVTTDVILARTEGMRIVGPNQQSVILNPREERSIFWTVQAEGLRKGFVYTLPVMAYDLRNVSSTQEFTVARGEPVLDEDDAARLTRMHAAPDVRNVTRKVTLDCQAPEVVFVEEPAAINCTLTNTGTSALPSVEVCHDDTCSTVRLHIGASQQVRFPIRTSSPGKYVDGVTSPQVDEEVTYMVLDRPDANITLSVPEQVGFGDVFAIEFRVERVSFASVPAGRAQVSVNGREVYTWSFTDLERPHEYRLNMRGSDLTARENEIGVQVVVDGDSIAEATALTTLEGVTWWQRGWIWLNALGSWFNAMF